MARKTEKKYLKKFKKEALREDQAEGKQARQPLKKETKHGIALTILFLVGALSVLSLFGWAGGFGNTINDGLGRLFGWGKFAVPLVLLLLWYFLWKPEKYALRSSNYIGLILCVAGSSAFFHLFIPIERAASDIALGKGGGYIGLALSYPLQKIMGPWATGLIILGVFVVGLLLLFDTSLGRLYERGNIFRRVRERYRLFRERLRVNLEQRRIVEQPEPSHEASPSFQVKDMASKEAAPTAEKPVAKEQLAIFPKPKPTRIKLDIPLDLLEASTGKPQSGDIELNKQRIQQALKNFGIEVEMGEVKVGPTVTQYTLKPSEGVKLSQITSLNNDLALALAAHPIRIEAPIPGKSLVGIEVPNKAVATVKLKDLLATQEFKNRSSNLSLALGKDVADVAWFGDLERMPHLLIAGATGSGKTVCINTIIMSLLYQNSPSDLKLILVDPKKVELPTYNNIPYLLAPVVTEVDKTINALRWIVGEMDRRFHALSDAGKRNIQAYNANGPEEPMPYIVVIIDELADLMAVAANEVESAIVRLAQMARAVGIHLIVATQRPSVDIITGLIKANITSRIAFSVASQVDSRTILDTSGAEKLLGRGDMLFMSPEVSKPKRIQGALVSDEEIERVVAHIKSKGSPEYNKDVLASQRKQTQEFSMDGDVEDDLLGEAKQVILQAGKASASLLQRRLRVGYARAARILDILEEQGFIGPGEGAKPREVIGGEPSSSSFEVDQENTDVPMNADDEPGQPEDKV